MNNAAFETRENSWFSNLRYPSTVVIFGLKTMLFMELARFGNTYYLKPGYSRSSFSEPRYSRPRYLRSPCAPSEKNNMKIGSI